MATAVESGPRCEAGDSFPSSRGYKIWESSDRLHSVVAPIGTRCWLVCRSTSRSSRGACLQYPQSLRTLTDPQSLTPECIPAEAFVLVVATAPERYCPPSLSRSGVLAQKPRRGYGYGNPENKLWGTLGILSTERVYVFHCFSHYRYGPPWLQTMETSIRRDKAHILDTVSE